MVPKQATEVVCGSDIELVLLKGLVGLVYLGIGLVLSEGHCFRGISWYSVLGHRAFQDRAGAKAGAALGCEGAWFIHASDHSLASLLSLIPQDSHLVP